MDWVAVSVAHRRKRSPQEYPQKNPHIVGRKGLGNEVDKGL